MYIFFFKYFVLRENMMNKDKKKGEKEEKFENGAVDPYHFDTDQDPTFF